MRKLVVMLTGAAALAAAYAQGDCHGGVLTMNKTVLFSNRGPGGFFGAHIYGTENGAWLQSFQYSDPDAGIFLGDRVLSFVCGEDPTVGTYADVWIEGRLNGTTRVMHLIATDWDKQPSSFVEYALVKIYRPGTPSTPIFERFYVTGTIGVSILCDCQPGQGEQFGNGWSTTGLASNNVSSAYTTNRLTLASIVFWVAGTGAGANGQVFYNEPNPYPVVFKGNRIRSFHCTSDGVFGRTAEFWVDGYQSTSVIDPSGTARVARFIVTDSASDGSLEYAYVGIFHPANLSKPIYERVLFMSGNGTNILCPDH